MSCFSAPVPTSRYNGCMSRRRNHSSRREQNRTTVFWAFGTFALFTVVTLVGWKVTRPAAAPDRSAAASAAAYIQAAAEPAPESSLETFERTRLDDFRKALEAGQVTVIDVRPMEAYLASHIPGSLHIPVTRIEAEIPYLPRGKPIVTYCSCPAEESSGEAAIILVRGGMPAKALQGGFENWTGAGFPTETGVK